MSLLGHHWEKISWEKFEELCVYFAGVVFPERRFQKYGRMGEKQDGIDIISKNERGENIICIQCKRYNAMDPSIVKNAIDDFEKGDLVQSTSNFIIATKASLDKRTIVELIKTEQKRIHKRYGIALETWDINYIETELKKNYTLVSAYFGEDVANNICHNAGMNSVPYIYEPVYNFIPRSIIPYSSMAQHGEIDWLLGTRELNEISNLFIKDLSNRKCLCVVADAYQGKSSLLKQFVYDISHGSLRLKPVLLNIKEFSNRAIMDILNNDFTWWRAFPIKEIVIVIDGLDEVETDRFLDIVKQINELSIRYQQLSIVFSCRKLFFNHFEVLNIIREFHSYELYPLESRQIDNYLNKFLNSDKTEFDDYIQSKALSQFLYHPFYLKNLVKTFKHDRGKLPSSRSETIGYFVSESFNAQASRIIYGKTLKRTQIAYELVLQKFAFSLQLLGKNVLSDLEIQRIFTSDEDKALLKESSLISFSKEQWSFENAMFQEYLAAMMLKNLAHEKILEFISIGQSIKKIKTKWIQTLISLLSLLDSKSEEYTFLLEVMQDDNIELITLCENNFLDQTFKDKILSKIIGRFEKLDIRPLIVHEDSISRFIGNSASPLLIICKKISQTASTKLKITLWRILEYNKLSSTYKNIILDLAKEELGRTEDGIYANVILQFISAQNAGSSEFVNYLLTLHNLNSKLEYRDQIYSIILKLNLVEEFYMYSIDGIGIMLNTPQSINSIRIERHLEDMLLATRKRKHIRILLRIISSDNWMNFHYHNYSSETSFINRLTSSCILIHNNDPLIVIDIIDFLKDICQKHILHYFKDIDRFFIETRTNVFAARYLSFASIDIINNLIDRLITFDCIDFLMDDCENNYLSHETFTYLIHSLNNTGKQEIADKLLSDYIATTGREDPLKASKQRSKEREEYEQRRFLNDIKVIQNFDSFSDGIKKYFQQFGKPTISVNDIFISYQESRAILKEVESDFINKFILWMIRGKKYITESSCLNIIANRKKFNDFRLYELLHYPSIGKPGNETLTSLLKSLYLQTIPNINFKNAIKQTGAQYTISHDAVLVTEIFQKMLFPTDPIILLEMLWLDQSGITNLIPHSILGNHQVSLSECILS